MLGTIADQCTVSVQEMSTKGYFFLGLGEAHVGVAYFKILNISPGQIFVRHPCQVGLCIYEVLIFLDGNLCVKSLWVSGY